MLEQRRCQRGATREDKVRAVLRLDAANVLDDVRSKALERAPFKTFRTVGSDIFCCRIEAVRHRTARRLWPEARPEIVGATAKQQIEPLAMRCEDCIPACGGPIGRGPVAVGEIAVIGGVLDHAVQRDVFHDFELSHLSLLGSSPCGKRASAFARYAKCHPTRSGLCFEPDRCAGEADTHESGGASFQPLPPLLHGLPEGRSPRPPAQASIALFPTGAAGRSTGVSGVWRP